MWQLLSAILYTTKFIAVVCLVCLEHIGKVLSDHKEKISQLVCLCFTIISLKPVIVPDQLTMHVVDCAHCSYSTHTHTHTHLTVLCPGLPGWAGTRKVKPIWILLKQETVSGSGISWTICKFAPRFRQITMPAPQRSVFYRPDALTAAQPTVSKHWRQLVVTAVIHYLFM